MKWLIFVVFSTCIANLCWGGAKGVACAEAVRPPLFDIEASQLDEVSRPQYNGLTPYGLQILKEQRDAIRYWMTVGEQTFSHRTTMLHMGLVAQAYRGHFFMFGPPGEAKTALAEFLFRGQEDLVFQIQLNQMQTTSPFTGGQDIYSMREGRYHVNSSGSMMDHKRAVLDEIPQANPHVLSAILSLLNPNERAAYFGANVVDSQLESMAATSNSSPSGLIALFQSRGLNFAGEAFLNRIAFKTYSSNTLHEHSWVHQNEIESQRQLLSVLSKDYPQLREDKVFLSQNPPKIDWQAIRALAIGLLYPTIPFQIYLRSFLNDLNRYMSERERESEEQHIEDRRSYPFIFRPSAIFSESLRNQAIFIIQLSVFIDFLLSPLAEDENLESFLESQIALFPDSIWRSHLFTTTIIPGRVRLFLMSGETGEKSLDIKFGKRIAPSATRGQLERFVIQSILDEQDIFRSLFVHDIKELQEEIKTYASLTSDIADISASDHPLSFDLKGSESIEMLMLLSNMEEMEE